MKVAAKLNLVDSESATLSTVPWQHSNSAEDTKYEISLYPAHLKKDLYVGFGNRVMPEAITGSWFPSGFHGHFRSNFRNDISQDYRMEAKPHPPTAFMHRMRESPTKHIFSKYENRHVFPNSVSSFENGLGKKKILENRESHNFTTWIPLQEEMKRQRPILSTYRTDFWAQQDKVGKVPQLLVPRLNRATTASCSGLTTYRHMLRSQANLPASQKPSTTVIPMICNSNREGSTSLLLQRAKSAPYQRLTVSDCLIWRTPGSTQQESLHSNETT